MEFKDFTYIKANNTKSDRTLLVLSTPDTNYFGIDLSDMLTEDFAAFSEKYNALHREYKQAVSALMQEFDLTHNYRQFSPERMSDVTTYYGWDE